MEIKAEQSDRLITISFRLMGIFVFPLTRTSSVEDKKECVCVCVRCAR